MMTAFSTLVWVSHCGTHFELIASISGLLRNVRCRHGNFLSLPMNSGANEPFSLMFFRYFSSRSANCCIPGKKARRQRTRVKTDTRTSCPVSHAATCHFLSLQLPVERLRRADSRQLRGLSAAPRFPLRACSLARSLKRGSAAVNSHLCLCVCSRHNESRD